MNLCDKLPVEDMELIRRYINYYGGSSECDGHMEASNMPYFLRYWGANKAPFYSMFGEQFILKREISFERDFDDLMDEMENEVRYRNPLSNMFRRAYMDYIDRFYTLDYEDRYELKRFVSDMSMLVKNEYDGEPFCIPGELTVNHKPLQINKGAKVSKMLGKICQALGFTLTKKQCTNCNSVWSENETHCHCGLENTLVIQDGYEAFRRAHSLALNQKRVRGTLCLSIHPLDFITMSDNECGWSSCMSWVDEPGDYRLGTIEMMNSPYAVIAYVEAANPMSICNNDTWNNKRWRQLLMITPELLLGNKQYPYSNDELQGAAMKWLRELANATSEVCAENGKRFGPYCEESCQIRNSMMNIIGIRKIRVNLCFDYMYNDIYDYRLAFISSAFDGNEINYNLSGPAVCTNCGEVILKNSCEDVEPHWTLCRECCGMWKCWCCGDWHYGEPYYVNDNPYCDYCYRHETQVCEICGERVERTEGIYIEVLPENENSEHETYNWNFIIDACADCIEGYTGDFERYFGKTHTRRDMWGIMRQIVSIDNISDEGLELGGMSRHTIDILKQVRDTKSYEERVKLLEKNFY